MAEPGWPGLGRGPSSRAPQWKMSKTEHSLRQPYAGYDGTIRHDHPELASTALVTVSTPDFKDAFQDGWAKTVTALVDNLVLPASPGRRTSEKSWSCPVAT